jgi:hypothetical protein
MEKKVIRQIELPMPGRDEISKMTTSDLVGLHTLYNAFIWSPKSDRDEGAHAAVIEQRNYIFSLLKYRATCARSELDLIPEECGGLRKL